MDKLTVFRLLSDGTNPSDRPSNHSEGPYVVYALPSEESLPAHEASAAAEALFEALRRAGGGCPAVRAADAPQEERERRLRETRRPVIETTLRAYDRALAITS